MSNIHSVWSSKKAPSSKNKKDEFFGTGGQQSGTGVLRPVKKQNDNDNDDDHDHDHDHDDEDEDDHDHDHDHDSENDNDIFKKLQDDPDFLKKLMELQQQQGMQAQANMEDAVYIYKNGFKIGNGPFQADTNPENKKFLAELKAGHVPKQLEPILREKLGPDASTLGVNVVDKQNENYVPPVEEKKFEAFQGTGHSLLDDNKDNNKQINALSESVESKELTYDDKDESTKIQVVLYNGKRETITVNLKNTILELHAHIKYISNYDGKFQLLAGFPPQVLDNPLQTIREAKLQGARVSQKASK